MCAYMCGNVCVCVCVCACVCVFVCVLGASFLSTCYYFVGFPPGARSTADRRPRKSLSGQTADRALCGVPRTADRTLCGRPRTTDRARAKWHPVQY